MVLPCPNPGGVPVDIRTRREVPLGRSSGGHQIAYCSRRPRHSLHRRDYVLPVPSLPLVSPHVRDDAVVGRSPNDSNPTTVTTTAVGGRLRFFNKDHPRKTKIRAHVVIADPDRGGQVQIRFEMAPERSYTVTDLERSQLNRVSRSRITAPPPRLCGRPRRNSLKRIRSLDRTVSTNRAGEKVGAYSQPH